MSEPGKYDDLCSEVRKKAGAKVCLLIIIGGNNGSGFSAQMPGFAAADVPDILRDVANQIERDKRGLENPHG
jgi:hypothetical protein